MVTPTRINFTKLNKKRTRVHYVADTFIIIISRVPHLGVRVFNAFSPAENSKNYRTPKPKNSVRLNLKYEFFFFFSSKLYSLFLLFFFKKSASLGSAAKIL